MLPELAGGQRPGQPEPYLRQPAAMLACLRSTPAGLATLTDSLSAEAWLRPPAPRRGMVPDRDRLPSPGCGAGSQPAALRKVLAEENPFLPGVVTDVWVKERNSVRRGGGSAGL